MNKLLLPAQLAHCIASSVEVETLIWINLKHESQPWGEISTFSRVKLWFSSSAMSYRSFMGEHTHNSHKNWLAGFRYGQRKYKERFLYINLSLVHFISMESCKRSQTLLNYHSCQVLHSRRSEKWLKLYDRTVCAWHGSPKQENVCWQVKK